MPAKPGKNAGISGVIDLPTAPGGQQLLQVLIRRWDLRVEGTPRARRGRGGGRFGTYRWIMASGLVTLGFRIQSESPPTPEEWNGLEGNLTIAYTRDKTITYPVSIGAFTHSFTPQSEDTWSGFITAQITGAPTYSEAWGDAPIPSSTSKADQIQWEGSVKTHDPNGLQSTARLIVDWWDDIDDTDTAEVTKITTVLGETTEPMTGLKVRTATFARDAIDGGTIAIDYALTDTAEDIINAGTSKTIDAQGLVSQAQGTAINGTPSTPTGDTFVTYTTTTRELNDGKTATVVQFGLRTSKQAIEMDGSFVSTDPSDLKSAGRQTSVYNTGDSPTAASIPSGLQTINTTISTINPQKKQAVYDFAKNTSAQDVTFGNSYTITDPSGLQSVEVVAEINDSDPDAATSLVSRGIKAQTLNPDNTLYIKTLGVRSTQQDLEFPGTFTIEDVSDIESAGKQTSVYTWGGSVTAASVPTVGGVALQTVRTRITQENVTKGIVQYDFEIDNPAQKIAQRNTFKNIDVSGIKTTAQVALVNGTPTAPTSAGVTFVKRSTRTEPVTHLQDVTVEEYGLTTPKQDVEFAGTVYGANPQTPDETVTTEVISTTLSGDAYRDSLFGTLRDDATFRKLEVKQMVPGLLEVKTTKNSENIILIPGSIQTFEDSVNAIPVGGLSGTAVYGDPDAKVKIGKLSAVVTGGPGGATAGRIDPIRFWRSRGSFTVRRYYSDTLANLDDFLFAAQVGTTNDDVFLGYAANHVMFEGATHGYAIPSGSNKNVLVVDLHFATDSHMFFSDRNCSQGWHDADGVTIANTGYFSPEVVFDVTDATMWTIAWPGESDFDGFIT